MTHFQEKTGAIDSRKTSFFALSFRRPKVSKLCCCHQAKEGEGGKDDEE